MNTALDRATTRTHLDLHGRRSPYDNPGGKKKLSVQLSHPCKQKKHTDRWCRIVTLTGQYRRERDRTRRGKRARPSIDGHRATERCYPANTSTNDGGQFSKQADGYNNAVTVALLVLQPQPLLVQQLGVGDTPAVRTWPVLVFWRHIAT